MILDLQTVKLFFPIIGEDARNETRRWSNESARELINGEAKLWFIDRSITWTKSEFGTEMDGRTDERTDGRTNATQNGGQTDGRTNGRTDS